MPILLRTISTPLFTKGVLLYDNDVLCHTLELPWNDNQRNVSCIPQGIYDCYHSTSLHHGSVMRLSSVPGRTGILIHAGNDTKDTRGCILVGLDVNSFGLLHSKKAMDRLFTTLPMGFKLNIMDIYNDMDL